jgi:heat shock 70kDa protein 1/2/6/8
VMSFPTVVTRSTLQILHQSSYGKVLALAEQCLLDAKVDKSAIDGLVITGEPLYTAKIRPILQEYLEGAKICSEIKSEEVVVQGVASIARFYASEDWVRDCNYDVPPTWEILYHLVSGSK